MQRETMPDAWGDNIRCSGETMSDAVGRQCLMQQDTKLEAGGVKA